MNERIKLLAEQAGYYLYDLTETHECKTVETDSTDEWITLEKFAELIVLECVTLADKESERYSNLDQEYCSMAMDNYRELVRKHFGVEE
jgi:hypothetical protein